MKPSMAVPISTKSAVNRSRAERRRYRNKVRRRHSQKLLIQALVLVLVGGTLLVHPAQAPQAKPDLLFVQSAQALSAASGVTPETTLETNQPTPEPTLAQPSSDPIATNLSAPVLLSTLTQDINYEDKAPILYYSQSGDSLDVLAIRFGVGVSEITSTGPIPEEGFIPEGQLLLIPSRLDSVSSNLKLFPDSELVNSQSALDFDVETFVAQAGGYLSTYHESVYASGYLSGAEIIKQVALDFSIHPRLLLAVLEYQSGWVYGSPETYEAEDYPMGLVESGQRGLYKQLVLAAGKLGTGYYGWREGTMVALIFPDGMVLRLASELNCGSVGLMYFFSQVHNRGDWETDLYADHSFLTTYENMFGSPWLIAQQYEPLFTPDVLQPEMILPFELGITWSYTSGPHAAWGAAEV
ncbi:MAG: LysM domain-containing protein, partial [Anaerolineaceae bacterium]